MTRWLELHGLNFKKGILTSTQRDGGFMKGNIFIILTIFASGCCSFDKKDMEFNDKELAHFSDYKIGDTIYFQSNLGDIDTIMIVGFGTERNENCGGFMAPRPVNGKWVQIKHLPVDKWIGTSQDMTIGGKIDTVYQELLWISKHPTEKEVDYHITFKDFHSKFDTIIGEFHTDTVKLNDLNLSNYYLVKHAYPERITEPKNIESIFWTDKLGITAYRTKDGETWTKQSKGKYLTPVNKTHWDKDLKKE